MPLTETAIRKAGLKNKAYKLTDEKGLFLLVNPNGSKYWRLKYRFRGKEKQLSVGVYPDVSLKTARQRRDSARKLLKIGVDPSVKLRAMKVAGIKMKTRNELIDAMHTISDEAHQSGFSFCAALTTSDGTPSATIFCGEPLRVLGLTVLIKENATGHIRRENS